MRAIDIHGSKGPKTALFLTTLPAPEPKPDDALIRVRAFGINRMDILQREGMYPLPPQAPSILGVEFSGVIQSFGSASGQEDGTRGGFGVGDEVFGLAYGGAYAEYIAVSVRMLIKKPGWMSWEMAAAIPETWITALQALTQTAPLTPPQTLLLHAGASAVSQSAAQLAHHLGSPAIYATAGSPAKLAFITQTLGATAAYNYKTDDWASEILSATRGRGVDVVIDFVGADYFQRNLDVAAVDGRIVVLGLLSGGRIEGGVDISPLLRKRLRVEGSTLRSRDVKYQGQLRDELEKYMPQFESGEFMVFIEQVMPWEKIQEAHGLLEENKTCGKIVCTID